ncbi:hypothetical protein N7E81_11780 [Reichenbachiella carrageenanivorans]|uniref:TerB family tellurite resistance protein n=1 Tax=Reichenbachiella carrageenanivorans TaxID=2979869 RepID=A0ABY6CVZ4_9BACT|nr:hypothetical protein [Reichenbachiella carrageenanivorans]UXX78038.1 hypothetical protein N7E81_11780 [Reichenbachiella carrageenanivorans]
MTRDFLNLRDDEIELLYEAPALVALLIAGADGKIDSKELKAATKFVTEPRDFWVSYFLEVGERMPVILNRWTAAASNEMDMTMARITVALRQLNGVLSKLDVKDSVRYYDFLLQLSEKVASASGGVFGFNKISKEEAALLNLPMLDNPVRYQFS